VLSSILCISTEPKEKRLDEACRRITRQVQSLVCASFDNVMTAKVFKA